MKQKNKNHLETIQKELNIDFKLRDKIAVTELTLDAAAQARTVIKESLVQEYKEAMKAGWKFPPIYCVQTDNKKIVVVDGWHRVLALRAIQEETKQEQVIDALVMLGSMAEAKWNAAAANSKHGERRTNKDKARAVALALEVKPDAPYSEIADWCGVSIQMVSDMMYAKTSVEEVRNMQAELQQQHAAKELDADDDETGLTLADRMKGAAKEIYEAIGMVEMVQERIDLLIETEAGAYINPQSVKSDLKNICSALKQSQPHRVCPICAGIACETCRMLGWVSKKQFDLLPKIGGGGA